MADIQLGDRAKDLLSGLTGIVTATSQYLNGCRRYCITPEAIKDNKPAEGYWYDENEVALVKSGVATWGVAKKKLTFHGARGGDPSGR